MCRGTVIIRVLSVVHLWIETKTKLIINALVTASNCCEMMVLGMDKIVATDTTEHIA